MIISRIKKKLWQLVSIVVASLVVYLVVLLLLFFLMNIFPEDSNTISLLMSNDTTEIKKGLLFLFNDSNNRFLGEFMFLGLYIVQVVISPIPGQAFGFLGGLVYGFWKGLFLTITGMSIGVYLVLMVTRMFRPYIVTKILSDQSNQKFKFLFGEKSLLTYFVIFLLPGLPDDAICVIAGLSNNSILDLMIVSIVGRLPGTIMVVLTGSSLADNGHILTYIFAGFISISILAWFFDEEVVLLGKKIASSLRKS